MNRHIGQDHKTAAKVAITVVSALLVAAVLITLPGCSTVHEYTTEAVGKAKEVNDQYLANVEEAYCNGPTDGALARRYGDSNEVQEARNTLCGLIRSKHYSR